MTFNPFPRKRLVRLKLEARPAPSRAMRYLSPLPAAALTMALREARVAPEEVDYINAHATSTPVGDPSEVRALKLALGEGTGRAETDTPRDIECPGTTALLVAAPIHLRD